MGNYIALLRGINVGGKNVLPMKELTRLLQANGLQEVKTYIQSGNVIFQSTESLKHDIGTLIAEKFGFKPHVLILSQHEFLSAIDNNPFNTDDGKSVHFYFCQSPPTLNNEKLKIWRATTENTYLQNNVFYLHAPQGIGRSKLVANIETCLGTPATGRNLNTIRKLQQLLAAD